ncbi:MAG TPA: metalloregulator ArsR/SmtB family transcription factor [Polyangiales bacterium]|nr:metalloregulator ArsR/SmtB family transcription factor [Polyangiales bacterium]
MILASLRKKAYKEWDVQVPVESDKRWELYRVLAEPVRLRLLALAATEELSIGELSELLGESQSNVSRHAAALRKLGMLTERRQGTRVFVRLLAAAERDAVIHDALEAGRTLCASERVFDRVPELIRRRDAASREFFAKAKDRAEGELSDFPAELPAYLSMLSGLIPRRELAIEIGTGDGRLLEVLAPLFEHVIAVDREAAQLELAQQRMQRRGHRNVELLRADLNDAASLEHLPEADVVIASRVVHHAPRPADALRELARRVRPGGSLLVLDYEAHDDEAMREQQADLWLGFGAAELQAHAKAAGLSELRVAALPSAFHPAGPDAHLSWHVLSARRPVSAE